MVLGSSYADIGLVRLTFQMRPVGAGFVVGDRYILTCAHVVNASLGRDLFTDDRPDGLVCVDVRIDGQWHSVDVVVVEWVPCSRQGNRGDIAVLEMTSVPSEGIRAVPLRRLRRSEDHPFSVQGFSDGVLIGATGWIRCRFTFGEEWIQIEDDKVTGRAVARGFSGAPIWDDALNGVVGMAVAQDVKVPAAKIAAMVPVDVLARYCPTRMPSRLAMDPNFETYWAPRARGVESPSVPGSFFTDRQQALSELVAWLIAKTDPPDNLRVVGGGPGSGKSAVLAQLVARSEPSFRAQYPLAPHDALSGLPAAAVDAAIHVRNLDSGRIISALASALDSDATDVDMLITDLAMHGRPATFVVDGLDESSDPQTVATDLRNLAWRARDLELRLLVGTRPASERMLYRRLGTTAAERTIDLDAPRYSDKASLKEYVRRRLTLEDIPSLEPGQRDTPYRDHPDEAELIAGKVADRAYPSFLIATLTSVELVSRNKVVDMSKDGWDKFPNTVADAMRTYIEQFSPADQDKVIDLLRPLAYIYGDGLAPGTLWTLLGGALARRASRRYDAAAIDWLLDNAGDYLLQVAGNPYPGETEMVYRLYHQALVDYLRGQDSDRGINIEERTYRQLLASVPPRSHRAPDWEQADPYIRTHLADHAAATGHLDELLDDTEFLMAADPAALTACLRQHPEINSPAARTYRAAANVLGDPTGRLLQLQLHAARLGERRLGQKLAKLAVPTVPHFIWTHEPDYTLESAHNAHIGGVWMIAMAELDGRQVVVSASSDRTMRLCDLATGQPIGVPFVGHTGDVTAVAVAILDGRPVAISGGLDTTLRLWDLATSEPIGPPIAGHTGTINDIAVATLSGRDVFISASADATVRVWDLATGNPCGDPFIGHIGEVQWVDVIDLDGRPAVVSGSVDSTIRVWDLAIGTPVGSPIIAHPGGVWAGVGTKLGGRPVVVSGGVDATVRVWDPATGAPVGAPFVGHAFGVWALAVADLDGRPVVVSGSLDMTLRVWDLVTGELLRTPITANAGGVWTMRCALLHGRPVAVSAGGDSVVRVSDLDTGASIGSPPPGHSLGIWGIALAELDAGVVAVSAGTDSTIRLWDLATGDQIGNPLIGHTGGVSTVVTTDLLGPPAVLSIGGDATIRLWDLTTGIQLPGSFIGHTGGIWGIALAELHDQLVAISGGADATVRVWDLTTGDQIGAPFVGHTAGVQSVTTGTLNGRPVVVSGGLDMTIRVWDLATGTQISDPLIGTTGIFALTMGELGDRSIVVSAGVDSVIRVWDLATGTQIGDSFIGHAGGLWSVTIIQLGGRPALISGGDSTVRVWDLATGRTLNVIHLDVAVFEIATTPANQIIIGHDAGLTAIQL